MKNNTRTASPGARQFTTVDVENVDCLAPHDAIKTFVLNGKPRIVKCDIFIAGGGMGGIAAAIRACKHGLKVCVSEETSWIGGQMTAQGVSAFDENMYVEDAGATRLYKELRDKIRQHYRQLDGASVTARDDVRLNPGNCWVSWLGFEPKIGLQKLHELIEEETPSRTRPDIHLRTKVMALKAERGRLTSALAVNLDTGRFVEFRPRFVLDATECGDLLPMAELDYSIGAEARAATGEAHAPEQANPDNVQDFTYPFVVDLRPGADNVFPQLPHYEDLRDSHNFSLLGYKMFEHVDGKPGAFWTYRRLVDRELFPAESGYSSSDIAMINWESHDLRGHNIIDVDWQTQAERLALGKLLSLNFLRWMQTEVPRDDGAGGAGGADGAGGAGYREIALRFDQLGTRDGLSKYPYIRESRRLKARKLITEEEIATRNNNGARARLYKDSVGIGLYPIDIHGHQEVPGAGQAAKPFQIPLAAMVQTKLRNFLPACKNIGTSHVTNGAYRLHPIEWAIGEAAGETAAFCLKYRARPESVLINRWKLSAVQCALLEGGAPLFWFEDVALEDSDFAAIHYASLVQALSISSADLLFRPDDTASAEDRQRAAAFTKLTMPAGLTRRALARFVYAFIQRQIPFSIPVTET